MRNNKGFSLVELIVVIAIMAILAAVAIPTFATFIGRANEASDNSFLNDIEYALELATTKDGGLDGAVTVTITNGVVSDVKIGSVSVYTPADDDEEDDLDTYSLASVVDLTYSFKAQNGKSGSFTDADNNGEWTFAPANPNS